VDDREPMDYLLNCERVVHRLDDICPRVAHRRQEPHDHQLAASLGLSGVIQCSLGGDASSTDVSVVVSADS